jgi:Rho termination factor-like protein
LPSGFGGDQEAVKRLLLGAGIAVLGAILLARLSVPRKIRSFRDGSVELDELPKDELYRRAQAADIAGRSQMTKQELIEALKEAE